MRSCFRFVFFAHFIQTIEKRCVCCMYSKPCVPPPPDGMLVFGSSSSPSSSSSKVKLAVSLHAANDRERSALLPVNRRFPLSELMEACREYVDVSGRRMTFEWALIQGENDSSEVWFGLA